MRARETKRDGFNIVLDGYTYQEMQEKFLSNCSTEDAVRLDVALQRLNELEELVASRTFYEYDSKDLLIEALATKLLQTDFGACYMCTNPMKNVTLDGVNNGCDGMCNMSEKFTVNDLLKKVTAELDRKAAMSKITAAFKEEAT